MKIAAIYARVSSNKQREEKTIDSQLESLLSFADKQGCTVPSEYIFQDEGYSGTVLIRPGLEQLRDLAAEEQIQTVLVYSPDRLSRKYAYQVLLIEEFARHGVEVIFLKSPKANTPEEELLLQFQGMIAEYERAQIAERCRRGKKYRAKSGCVSVLAGAPYGYRYIKKSDMNEASYQTIKEEAKVVKKIFRLYTQEGMSARAITKHLTSQGIATSTGKSRWSHSTVTCILKNPAYKGKACYGKTEQKERQKITRPLRLKGGFSPRPTTNHRRNRQEWLEIPVPAIISEEVFDQAQELFERNKQLSLRNTKEPTLLQGLLVCSECSYSLYRNSTNTTKRKIYYYRCLGSDAFRHGLSDNARICGNRPIRQDLLEEVVWQQIMQLLENPVLIREEIDKRYRDALNSTATQQKKETINKDFSRVNNGVKKLLDAYQEGLITLCELRQRMPELRKRESSLTKELQNLEAKEMDKNRFLELEMKIDDFLKCLRKSSKSMNVLERQKVIRLIVKEILVGKEKIIIRHSIPVPRATILKENSSSLLRTRGAKSSQ